jgi:AcrR family transcriptional regulator
MTFVTGATNPQERILHAAADLFAEVGYSGASTRDIAKMAAVNDATVYRHFLSKKVLFAAVLEAELKKLSVRADLMVHVANAENIRAALAVIFELLTEALAGRPRLLRLLHFSVLEFGSDLQPLYHKYLGVLLDGAATYLESWREREDLHCEDPRAMIVAFAVTVVGLQTLYPLFGGEPISLRPRQENAARCTELWRALLVGGHRGHQDRDCERPTE